MTTKDQPLNLIDNPNGEKPGKKANDNPIDRANLYYERAKQLSLLSSGTSLELERQLKEIYKAISFYNDENKFYMLLAKIYKQNLDITSAMFCYRFVLKREPANLAARRFLVDLLILKGKELILHGTRDNWKAKFISARSYFDEAIEYNRENIQLWIYKAVCHIHIEEYPEAFESISKIIRPNMPTDHDPHLYCEIFVLRAKINWARGLVEQGNQDIRFAASLNAEHPEVKAFIARSYIKSELLYKKALDKFTKGLYKEALEDANHALFITNEDVKLYLLQSKIHRKLNDLQSAYDSVLQCKAIFDSKYEEGTYYQQEMPREIMLQIHLILNEMAINFAMEGNYEKAILLFNKIIRTEGLQNEQPLGLASYQQTLFKYYMNRGDCYRALHELTQAILDYQEALRLQPKDWEILTRLSITYYLLATDAFNASDFRTAEVELTKAIEANPKVSEYYALRGKSYFYLSNYHFAFQDFQKTLELNPDNVEIRLRLQQFDDSNPENNNNPKPTKSITNNSTSSIVSTSQLIQPPSSIINNYELLTKSHKVLIKTMLKQQQREDFIDDLISKPSYTNERLVTNIIPESKDFIEMMLNPHKAQRLPPLKMLTTEKQQLQQISLSSSTPKDRFSNLPIIATSQSARVNPKSSFFKAQIALQDVHLKNTVVTKELTQRVDIRRDHLWSMVDMAKELATLHKKNESKPKQPKSNKKKNNLLTK